MQHWLYLGHHLQCLSKDPDRVLAVHDPVL